MCNIDNNAPATRRELIIATALNSLNFDKYDSLEDLNKALLKRVSTITGFMYPKSRASRIIDAIRIQATIKNIEFESSSQRFKIYFISDNEKDNPEAEVEIIRSDRVDNKYGEDVKKIWNKSLIGKHVTIFKTTEETGNPMKPKVRIAPYVTIIKDRNERTEKNDK